jgi:hypothetical protein
MEAALAAINATLVNMNAKLDKIDGLESTINEMRKEISTLHEGMSALITDNNNKDEAISQLKDQLNRCDQTIRANSLRIVGLPILATTTPAEIPALVYNLILRPCIEAARAKGDLPPAAFPTSHFLIESSFSIPTKRGSATPVIVKLTSSYIRSLVFKYKGEALAKTRDPANNKERCAFGIFEDLSPANYTLLRSFADDARVKSSWSYSGQIKFKLHDGDTVYRAKSLLDTVDSLTKGHPSRRTTPATSSQ